jgi:four helix bundle protein
MKTFEEIESWKKAKELTLKIYNSFKDIKDFEFKDQITRSSVTIMNNIAEGFGRESRKKFIRFLTIAKSSTLETQSMLILANEISYISEERYNELRALSDDILNLIGGFIRYLKTKKEF